jgi:ABC-type nitrate/sulfonate/bicarbonate transport system permease component
VTDPRPSTPSRIGGATSPALLGLAGLAGFALLLEIVPRLGIVSTDYLPPTSRIFGAFVDEMDEASFWTALSITLRTWALGLAIAVVAGIVLGVAIGLVPALRAVLASTIEFLRPVPSVAWIPILVVLVGVGMRSTILLVIYAAFWQVLVNVMSGVRDVDPIAMETARAYRLSQWERVRYVIWPTTLPYAVTGIRLATAVALILTVTGEMVIGPDGLGSQIEVARGSIAVATTYALIAVTGLLGVAANLATRAVERRVLRWHPSVRREVPV